MTTAAEEMIGGKHERPVRAGSPLGVIKTMRDEFAMAALPALIARHRADVAWGDVAPLAYKIADAMMEARGK